MDTAPLLLCCLLSLCYFLLGLLDPVSSCASKPTAEKVQAMMKSIHVTR